MNEPALEPLAWMAWTVPTALFFLAVFVMLAAMTLLQRHRPTVRRRGMLRMPTTRGDRLFISLLVAAVVHAAWLAVSDVHVAGASILSVLAAGMLLRWG